jgi:hypothetical protein
MDTILGRILALVVGGLAIVGTYETYASAMDSQHLESLQAQLATLQQNITAQYQRRSGRYAFGTMSAATAIANQLAPTSAINGGTALTNPFNGNYTLVGSGTNGIPASGFGVWIDNIPSKDCIKILETVGTGGGLSGGPVYGYQVAASVAAGGTTLQTAIPASDAVASSQCTAPGGDTVAILLVLNG